MNFDTHKNFGVGAVTVAPSPATSGTTISVSDTDAVNFPTPTIAYNAVIYPSGANPTASNAEIVRITAKGASGSGGGSNTQFTITRTQESSSARTVIIGDQMAIVQSAKVVKDIEDTINNMQGAMNYTVFKVSSTFYALNNVTNVIDYSNATFHTLMGSVMTAMASVGGRVLIKANSAVYSVGSDISIPSNTIIEGEGTQTQLQITSSTTANGLLVSGKSNVIIRNLQVDGNKASVSTAGTIYLTINGILVYGSTNVIVENCTLHDAYYGGVAVDTSTNVIIRDNRIYSCRDNGIFIRPDNTNVEISGNIVSGSAYSGIQALHSDYVNIHDNIAYSNGPTSAEGDGIGFEGCRYSKINNNVIYSNGIQGIKVDYTVEGSSTQRSLDCVVSDNTIYDHPDTGNGCGIEVLRSDNTIIRNNHIKTCKYGVNVAEVIGIQIIGNEVKSSASQGIRLHDSSASGLIVIRGNTVDASGDHGIETNQNNVQIIGNIVKGGSAQGIRLSDGDNYYIADNIIFDNADNGILKSSSAGATEIRNNYFFNTGTAQDRAVYEEASGGVCRMVNNRIVGQNTEPYQLNSTGSFAMDDDIWALKDGVSAPGTISGIARIYVDTSDGDLKIKFGDGTVKTIVVDT